MSRAPAEPEAALAAVLRTAQYLAFLRSDGDIWRELGRVAEHFYGADLVALLGAHPDGSLVLNYCNLSDVHAEQALLETAGALTREVLASGFLASGLLALPEPFAVAVLPLSREHQTTDALLIGHRSRVALLQVQLDLYLALAGLIEGTLARLGSERAASESARRYEEQRRIAEVLQEHLMSPLPEIEGLDLGLVMQAAHRPALIGGDFSEVFWLDESHVGVLIGDVAGKGVAAAGLSETVRVAVRAFAAIDRSPAFILRKTNELLLRRDHLDRFVTAFLLVLDRGSGRLAYASAGHPAPVHVGPGFCRPLAVKPGVPLGSFDRDYRAAHVHLGDEEALILYTDGVTEARRGEALFGSQRLIEAVEGLAACGAQQLAAGVRAAAEDFAGELGDDLQVLVLRRV